MITVVCLAPKGPKESQFEVGQNGSDANSLAFNGRHQ